jgi:ribonuclease-3 family protein
VSKVSRVTRAETQAAVVAALSAAHLSAEERQLVKWGRNAQTGKVPERLRASGHVYRDATSLEVLVGYLYVSNPARLEELMRCVGWDEVATGTDDDDSLAA